MIFLLPNKPLLPPEAQSYDDLPPSQLIDLNGNHWRKILTIIAKLVTLGDEDWRIVRDQHLWDRARLVFSLNELPKDLSDKEDWLFVVGNSFRHQLTVPQDALEIGERHKAYLADNVVWSPYLDYRQFPNQLIDALRSHLY